MDSLFSGTVIPALLKIILSLGINVISVCQRDPFSTAHELFNRFITLFFVSYDSGVDVEIVSP